MLNLQLGMPMGAYNSMWTSAETVGGVWNAGYRYDWGRVFIEPTATLTFSTTRIGRLNELAAYGVDARFGNGEDFRGGFGGRVGTTFVEIVPGHAREASFTGRVWDQFASNGGRVVDIMNGDAYHSLGDYTLGQVYGEAKGNLALLPAGPGLGAYVSGGARFNDQFTTWTARGGVAYRW